MFLTVYQILLITESVFNYFFPVQLSLPLISVVIHCTNLITFDKFTIKTKLKSTEIISVDQVSLPKS